jgi:YHS domain-containing protein
MINDPICGMEADKSEISFEFEGKKYFFCSQGCLEKFKSSPKEFSQKYVYDLVIIGAGQFEPNFTLPSVYLQL